MILKTQSTWIVKKIRSFKRIHHYQKFCIRLLESQMLIVNRVLQFPQTLKPFSLKILTTCWLIMLWPEDRLIDIIYSQQRLNRLVF